MKKYLIFVFVLVSLACFSLELPVPGDVSLPVVVGSANLVSDIVTKMPSSTPQPQCIVNTDVLNLRVCAGTRCTTHTWLREGTVLIILARQNQWLQVETQLHTTGWVHSKFCLGE